MNVKSEVIVDLIRTPDISREDAISLLNSYTASVASGEAIKATEAAFNRSIEIAAERT